MASCDPGLVFKDGGSRGICRSVCRSAGGGGGCFGSVAATGSEAIAALRRLETWLISWGSLLLLSSRAGLLGFFGGGSGRLLLCGGERRGGGGGGGAVFAWLGLGGRHKAKSLAQSEKAWSTRTSMRSAFSTAGGGGSEIARVFFSRDQGGGLGGGRGGAAGSKLRFGGGGGGGVFGMLLVLLGESSIMLGTADPTMSRSSWAKLWKYSSFSSAFFAE
mmetsp:Transcript_558/g.1257  ORF Transcript_558/g.1257 Transcript_558/m.1257 type:complete len:218 (-) Transcript_558:804-1457(-)